MGSERIDLPALDGANPLAYLAALGLLAVGERMAGQGRWRLGWTPTPVSTAFVVGAGSRAEIVEAVLADRDQWRDAPALERSADGDVKFADRSQCREYLGACRSADDDGRSIWLASALVAEGPTANNGKSKPSDLHFTSGNQRFIEMIREIRDCLTGDHVNEALWDGWAYASELPSLRWDVTDDRIYAYRATDPSDGKNKKKTVPGAEWLSISGLSAFPVFATADRRLRTTGCRGPWKDGSLNWCLWTDPKPWVEVSTIVQLLGPDDRELAISIGVFRILSSSIRRLDPGALGLFSPPRAVWERPDASPRQP